MSRRNTIGTALAVLAIVLFTVPAIFPIQPMLVHDTRDTASGSPAELEEQGYEIVAYENLTERGQELYVTTLKNGGTHRVAVGDGAPDYAYLNLTEQREAFMDDGDRPGIVIERPEDDSDLPGSDEEFYASRDENVNETEIEQRRQMIWRYDLMETSIEEPPLGATPQLIRLASVLLAVLSLGVGGYLISSK